MKPWFICVVLVFCSVAAWARHIIGGDISLIKRGTTNNDFTILLNLIYDDAIGVTDDKAFVSIFRKSNNIRLQDFTLNRKLKQELPYTNARCIGHAEVSRITSVQYVAEISLTGSTYNDTEGYYLAWEECCRSGNIINIQNPSRVGLTFYAQVPPLTIQNSTPIFTTPEVQYVCIGKNFEADFGATDTDKDDLKYALVTPLIGSTDGSGTFPAKAKQGPYNRAQWISGFDSTQAIPGKNPLYIDSKTGKIVLNASQLGMFAFAVRCEEWRNGVKIGEIRREFVFNVVDCISTPPPPANITIKQASPNVSFETKPNGHVISLELCQGDSALLKVDDEDPLWAYQWQKNGQYIKEANTTTLLVNQWGSYTVVKRFVQGCSIEDSTINTTTVGLKSTPKVVITSSRPLPLCQGDSTNLHVEINSGSAISWQKNKVNLDNITNQLNNVKEAANYQVIVTDLSSKCTAKDSITVRQVASPPAPLTLSGTPIFCSNDSVRLITPKNNNYEYVWFLGDFPLVQAIDNVFYPIKSGRYSVEVIDAKTKCATRSDSYDLIVKLAPTIFFDSIPPLCTSGLQAVSLSATPAGGSFSGLGVVGNRFITQNLTAGSYPITYTYTNTEGCSAKVTQLARLSPPPRLEVPKNVVILRGDSIEIKTSFFADATILWFPSIGLNNSQVSRPMASPDRTTVYKATITTKEGCTAEAETKITVIDLDIPNGFTPNSDGVNDTWAIAGIQDYPNCTVEIFNRWGNTIFSSKGYQTPWDGLWNGQQVPVGTYYYQIYLRELEYKLAGVCK
ncbi:MAG: gliding motility-associated C-terminal domain-containing protein [Spirosomataceae bacterium]